MKIQAHFEAQTDGGLLNESDILSTLPASLSSEISMFMYYAHVKGIPIFKGMEMIPTESLLPPQYVRGSPCTVVGLQLHPLEPSIQDRASLVSHGCVVLQYMPKCVYVRFDDASDNHLPSKSPGASQPVDFDVKGVMAVEPKPRRWTWISPRLKHGIEVCRTQIALLLRKQCTLHGVQGKTAEPGFIAHWLTPRIPCTLANSQDSLHIG